MSEVWLVRHGQAQTGASDEASYDRLSALGHQQAGDRAAVAHPRPRSPQAPDDAPGAELGIVDQSFV